MQTTIHSSAHELRTFAASDQVESLVWRMQKGLGQIWAVKVGEVAVLGLGRQQGAKCESLL